MEDLSAYLQLAVDAVQEAGRLALSMQTGLKDIHFKGDKDVVTEADFACDTAIRRRLAAAHPGHNLVTEEAGPVAQGSDFTWYADPIDGTVNYSRSFPLWGVSVGLRRGDSMVAGAVFLPALDELYTATLGGGAFLNGRPLRVSAVASLDQAVISHGDFNVGTEGQRGELNLRNFQARDRTAAAVQRVKCLGSAVLEGAFVAAGRMEAYCMVTMKPWDVAAISLLVAEAGGKVTRMDGGPFTVDGPDAVFSNGVLHTALLSTLRWTAL